MKTLFSLVSTLLLTLAGGSASGQEPLPDTFSRPISFQFHDSLQERGLAVTSKPVSFLYLEPLEDAGTGISLNLASSQQVSFSYGSPPPAALPTPVAHSPGTSAAPGPVLQTLTPLLLWRAAAGAEGYGLELTSLTTNDVVLELPQMGPATSHEVPPGLIVPGFHYAWTVRARLGTGFGPPSRTFHFRVAENLTPPSALRPVSPGSAQAPGATLSTLTPLFLWRTSAGTVGHALYVLDATTGRLIYGNEHLGTGGSFNLPPGVLEPGKAYRWNVRARNSSGWGASSPPFHFITRPEGQLLATPMLQAPGTAQAPGSGLATLTPEFRWRAVPGATGYDLFIADVASNTLIYQVADLPPDTTHILPGGVLQWGRAYRWNMRARAGPRLSLYSPRLFFQTATSFDAPVVSGMLPTSLIGSASAQPIAIQGAGFRAGARVLVTGGGQTDVLVAANQIVVESASRLRFSLRTGVVSGAWSLKVRNADGKTSPPFDFNVLSPDPSGTSPVPAISPAAGSFTQPVWVSLSHPGTVHFTTDGSVPTRLAPTYMGTPFLLGAQTPVTVRAIGVQGSQTASSPLSARYQFNLPSLALPGSRPGVQGGEGTAFYLKMSVPAGVSALRIESGGGSGNCDLYLSRGALPLTTKYQFSSRGADNAEVLEIESPLAGDWFLLLRGASTYQGVTVTTTRNGAQGTTPVPILNPTPGTHGSPLTLRLSCADAQAAIFYTLDGSDPAASPSAAGFNASTHLYNPAHPPILNASTTVRVRALTPGKRPSGVVGGNYTLNGDMRPLVFFSKGSGLMQIQEAALSTTVSWSNTQAVDIPFFFDVPQDDLGAGPVAKFPVALVVEVSTSSTLTEFYLREGNPATTQRHDFSSRNLPEKRDSFFSRHYILGSPIQGKGALLRPGRRYYGLFRTYGPSVPLLQSPHITLTLTRHDAALVARGTSSIAPGRNNTWVVAHGRAAGADSGTIVDLAQSLAQFGESQRVDQVLALHWGTMADPVGLPIISSKASLNEGVFIPGVGRRTVEVLRARGIGAGMTSLMGHSWGTYVNFEMAKQGKVPRLIALDPATTAFGGYEDSAVNFSRFATRSWAFWGGGIYGNPFYSGTAHQSFFLNGGQGPDRDAKHTAPVQFFAHVLRSNHDSSYRHKQTGVTGSFTLQRFDSQPTGTEWMSNSYPRMLFGTNKSKIFEAEIEAQLNDDGLDVTKPMKLRFRDKNTGSEYLFE